MQNNLSKMYVVLVAVPAAMLTSLFLFNALLPEWRWQSVPMHASAEAFGGLAAILLTLFIFQKDTEDDSGELSIVATGVLSMGIISIIHGMNNPGTAFVFLHSVAILSGGVWFALSWIPHNFAFDVFVRNRWITWLIAFLSILIGVLSTMFPDSLPEMITDGEFSSIANAMNVIAGALFLISVPRFMIDYSRHHKAEYFYFFSFALIFSIVGFTFSFSKLWDFNWWLWHVLRLIAYLVGLWFLTNQYVQMTIKQKQSEDELREHRSTLEKQVEERTSELEEQSQKLQENQATLQAAIQDYLHFTEKVSQGDLTVRLETHTHHGLGDLSQNLNKMVERLGSITGQISKATENISYAATEILSATSQQSSTAAEQSASIVQTTTTVDQIKAIAQQTAAQAGQLAQDSQSTLQVAHSGTQAVEDTIQGMNQIRQRVESIAQTILALSEQTQAIGTIITTVSEIADQSNMLALNAAIEAARAGEQGKSFAVVAQQVRELAERSKTATGQVQEILGEIQRATNNAVMVTEEGSKGVEVGVRLSGEASKVIHSIAQEVENGARANTQMAAASHQQTSGMEQIAQAMKEIQQATTQSLESTRQAEKVAQNLHALAQTLQESVAAYRV